MRTINYNNNQEIEYILALRCDIVTQCVKDYRECIKMKKNGRASFRMGNERYNVSKLMKECEDFLKSDACVQLGGVNGIGIMKEIQQQEGVL